MLYVFELSSILIFKFSFCKSMCSSTCSTLIFRTSFCKSICSSTCSTLIFKFGFYKTTCGVGVSPSICSTLIFNFGFYTTFSLNLIFERRVLDLTYLPLFSLANYQFSTLHHYNPRTLSRVAIILLLQLLEIIYFKNIAKTKPMFQFQLMCKLDFALRLLGYNWKSFNIERIQKRVSFEGLINGIF